MYYITRWKVNCLTCVTKVYNKKSTRIILEKCSKWEKLYYLYVQLYTIYNNAIRLKMKKKEKKKRKK